MSDWIYYLKNNKLPSQYSAKGLDSVSKKLKYDDMNLKSKIEYEAHQKELRVTYGVLETAKFEGREEGREEGLASSILALYKNNINPTEIAKLLDISFDKVNEVIQNK
jgi:predicted transposase/invertase (TIGR01784 family)